VTSGRVRYIGISNYNGWQTAKAATWQRAWPGRVPLASTQVEYSLLSRHVEAEVLPAAADADLGVLAWSPLGRGVLTGKYRDGIPADSRANSEQRSGFVRPFLAGWSAPIVDAVVAAAGQLGVSPAEVALAWVRDRPGVTAPVLGARTVDQLTSSLPAERLTLPEDIRDTLDRVSAR
jgi:aryl-alcohol dehydrogenase-like predicted oxidoreductase